MAGVKETDKTYADEDWKTFVLREPDTFMGSGTMETMLERVYDPVSHTVDTEPVVTSHAMKHTFTEALSNAQDSIMRAKVEELPAEYIRVKFLNQCRIEITNVGADIISVRKNERGVWIPETVLGNLLSGSNSKAMNKTWVGKNGVGGTLVNIFSRFFSVEVWDHVRKLYYRQEWRDNCTKATDEPLIVENGKGNFENSHTIPDNCGAVKVSFDLDFVKFVNQEFRESYPTHDFLQGMYSSELLKMYCRKVMDCSLATQVPVYLLWTDEHGDVVLDTVFRIPDIEVYSEKFFREKPGNFLVYKPAFPKTWKSAPGEGVMADLQAIIYDTPDEGYQFSFVNGQPTDLGGTHVDETCRALCRYVLRLAEDSMDKKDVQAGLKLTQTDMMNHLTVFVNVVVPDPKFTGQTKSRLTSPKPAVRWFESDIERVKEWSMVRAIYDTLEAKKRRLLAKTDGRKVRRINIPKAEDANLAGSSESEKCVLWFCEGDSAKNYALTLLENLEGGRDYNGIYPLSGKILNVMKASSDQMSRNKQVTEIKTMLGLQEAVDYSASANIRQLRYGKIGVLTDQDMDGNHIKYLLTVFFGTRFAGILVSERMITWMSPIIRAKRGRHSLRFFSMNDFHSWKTGLPPSEIKRWTIKYYKGLGGSTDAEVEEDARNPFVEVTLFDERANDSLHLAFDTAKIQERKKWISDFIRLDKGEEVTRTTDPGDGRVSGLTFEPAGKTLGMFLNGIDASVPKTAFGKRGKKPPTRTVDEIRTTEKEFGSNSKEVVTDSNLMVERKSITRGIHQDYMSFNLLTLKRAIPSEIDGLKVSERKVVWTALKTLKKGEEIKTAQFGNLTAKETDYAHNEQCLERVISALAQDFPTSNNLPHFKGNGQFGSRYRPKASSGRYTHVEKSFWLRYVYREEDDGILPMVFDEGRETEPEHLVPIIPMTLINGTCGIANGFSTFIPQYNPIDVIREMRRIIEGREGNASHIAPWYRGYKGNIDLIVEDTPDQRVIAMQSYGCYEELRGGNVKITELPVGTFGEDYRKKLNEWRENRLGIRRQAIPGKKENPDMRTIRDFNNLSKKNEMLFEVSGAEDVSYQSLNLTKRFGLTNMTLLESVRGDELYDVVEDRTVRGKTLEPYIPKRYETIEDYLRRFVRIRLYYYGIRKNHLVKHKKTELENLRSRHRFIQDVVEKVIDVFTWSEEKILQRMEERKHAESLYSQTPIRRFSPAEVERLSREIETAENELETLVATDVRTMWARDLQEFEDVYLKVYKGENGARSSAARAKIRAVKVKRGTIIKDDALADLARIKDPEMEDVREDPEEMDE